VALALWVAFRGPHASDPTSSVGRPEDVSAPPDGAATDNRAAQTGAEDEGGASFLVSDLARLASSGSTVTDAGGAGMLLANGAAVPALPLNAPRQIRFGVVLIGYSGAQPATSGGRVSSRSRAEAELLAGKLAVTAAQDFQAAVQQGDSGSSEDVGEVKLGVLEPAPEYVLFTLPIDGVGGPVDTPRGFWIVKRLE